jgi:hypothetical protein
MPIRRPLARSCRAALTKCSLLSHIHRGR